MISTTCGALLFFVSFCQFFSVLITVVADFILSWLGNALPTKSVMTGQKSRDFAYIEVLCIWKKEVICRENSTKNSKIPFNLHPDVPWLLFSTRFHSCHYFFNFTRRSKFVKLLPQVAEMILLFESWHHVAQHLLWLDFDNVHILSIERCVHIVWHLCMSPCVYIYACMSSNHKAQTAIYFSFLLPTLKKKWVGDEIILPPSPKECMSIFTSYTSQKIVLNIVIHTVVLWWLLKL